MVHMVTFTINIPPNVSIYTSTMDPMGMECDDAGCASDASEIIPGFSVFPVGNAKKHGLGKSNSSNEGLSSGLMRSWMAQVTHSPATSQTCPHCGHTNRMHRTCCQSWS